MPRSEAGLTQGELASRMVTTQSAIARMEGGGTRPTLGTLEKLAIAVGSELVIGVAPGLSENRSIAKLVREGQAAPKAATRQAARSVRPSSETMQGLPVPALVDYSV